MKKTIFFGLLLLCGCSHAYIASENEGKIVACCPSEKYACTEGNLKDRAQKECAGNLEKLVQAIRDTGNISVQRNLFNGDVLGVKSDTELCVAYKCESEPRSPASSK